MSENDKLEWVLRESGAQLKAAYGDLRSVPSSVRAAVVDHYWQEVEKLSNEEPSQ